MRDAGGGGGLPLGGARGDRVRILRVRALFVMVFEEPMLRRKFGEEYEAYYRQVPGWFPHFRNKLD